MDQKNLSDKFEDELDDFFKDRALERAQVFSDKSKKNTAEARNDIKADEQEKQQNTDHGSGCCMTGCYDCPWGYKIA